MERTNYSIFTHKFCKKLSPLIFSSEVKPILYVSQNSNELDFNSIITSWKFNSSDPGKTLLKNFLIDICRCSGDWTPDSFVDSYSWAGNAEEVSEAINDAIKAGIDGIVVHFHTPSGVPIDQAIRNFAEKVTPRITSYQNAE